MNILLIAIDTLRADHLSCYGYKRKTSPFLDNLAKEGVLFENFYAPGIPTHPSYTTVYTGLSPVTHRIVAHRGKVNLNDNIPVFTEELQKTKYTTCAVDNLWRMKPWFTRGYEFCIDPSIHTEYMQMVDCDTQNSRAIPWIKEHKNDKFFLFIHYWDPHTPYTPPEKYLHLFYEGNLSDPNNHSMDDYYDNCPYAQIQKKLWFWRYAPDGNITDVSFLEASYDAEIRYVDDGIKKLIEAMEEKNLLKDTLIIIFSDHGESLTEHGIYFDHHGLYENDIHVPLIMIGPGVPKNQRVTQLVQHIDLAPTILEAAGAKISGSVEGKSLWSLIKGEKTRYYDKLVTEESTRMCKWAISKDGYKLILAREEDMYGFPPKELYNLKEDPEEKVNLSEEKKELADRYEKELEDWIDEHLKESGHFIDPLKEQGITVPSEKGFMHPRKYW